MKQTTITNGVGRREFILAMAALSALAPFSTDTYLPAMSMMAESLSASAFAVQLSLTSFFVAFAFGQLLYGPLSERFGRKKPLYAGILLFIVASVGCALCGSVEALIFWRFLQALGASSGSVISKAMITDKYSTEESVTIYSTSMIVMGLAPLVAPLLGGYLIGLFPWQSIFWILGVIGVIVFALLLRLEETAGVQSSMSTFKAYLLLCRSRIFMLYSLIGGVSLGGMFAYISEAPFLFVEHFGLSGQQFAWLFALNALAFVLASKLNTLFLRKTTAEALIGRSLLAQAVLACALLVEVLWMGDRFWWLCVTLFFYMGSLGFIIANSTALALENLKVNASYAGALMGAVQFLIAGLSSAVVGMLSLSGSLSLASVIVVCALSGCAVFAGLKTGSRTQGAV